MSFLPLIRQRRSIRRFQPQPVEPEKIALLIEAALRAPSSRSLNPWEFIVVDDRQIINPLAQSKQHGSSFLKGAPLAIVVCADPNRCDVWIEDASIASIFISLAAEELGLGNCWIQIRQRMHNAVKTSETYVREVLGIPEQIMVESIIAVGYPAEQIPGHDRDELEYGKVYRNRYGVTE